MKIAFQGEKGAYSHLASLEIFPNAEVKACSTFEETFKLAKENIEYSIVIPIENSLAGRVADIHYLIPKYELQIHAEHFQTVNHNLLGIKGAQLKGATGLTPSQIDLSRTDSKTQLPDYLEEEDDFLLQM